MFCDSNLHESDVSGVGFFLSRIFPESDFSRVGFFPSRIKGAIGPEMVVLMGGFPESDFSRVGSEV